MKVVKRDCNVYGYYNTKLYSDNMLDFCEYSPSVLTGKNIFMHIVQ